MRIITGSLKGRRLAVPNGVDLRPTSDFTKSGIFNIIEARKGVDGCSVLDLFSGTGNLAFEAVSRGASRAVCVEADRKAAELIRKTAEAWGVADRVSVVTSKVETLPDGGFGTFDLIFADPPYDWPGIPAMPDRMLDGWLEPDGWFILEHDVRHGFATDPRCVFAKPYGKTLVSIFRA